MSSSSVRDRVMEGYVVKVSGPWDFVMEKLRPEFGEFIKTASLYNGDGTDFEVYSTIEVRLECVVSGGEMASYLVGQVERRELFQLQVINDEYQEYLDSLYSGPWEGRTEEEVNGGFVVLH